MVKLLGAGNKLSKVFREIEGDVPKVENALAKTAKEAEIAGELASKKSGALGERAYNTIDVDATNVTPKPTSLMRQLDDLDAGKMKPSEDAFSLGAGTLKPKGGGVDGPDVDVPFKGKKDHTIAKGVGAAAVLGGVGAGTAYVLRDQKGSFPAKPGDVETSKDTPSGSGSAVPTMKAAPGTNMPTAEKYADAYNKLKLPDQTADYAALQGELAKDINAANELYGQTKDKVAAKEMWDSIIKGIGHIAAGVYGQNTGLDLSGVKFEKEDWDKKRELAQSELRDSIQNARMKNAITKEQIDRSYARSKDQLEVDKSQIEAAERRDVQAATLKESYAKRKDEMTMKLAELGIKARETGDKDKIKALTEFKDMENRLDALATKWTTTKGDPLRAQLAAQIQQYQTLGEKLGMGPGDLQYMMSDINSSDDPENVHNTRMERIATAQTSKSGTAGNVGPTPPASKVEIMYKGAPMLYDPVTKTMTPK